MHNNNNSTTIHSSDGAIKVSKAVFELLHNWPRSVAPCTANIWVNLRKNIH